MRDTLIFKNVPGNEKSCEETTAVLCECIKDVKPTVFEDIVYNIIERILRVKRRIIKGIKPKGPDIIVAKFVSWKKSEKVKEIFWSKGENTGISLSNEIKKVNGDDK